MATNRERPVSHMTGFYPFAFSSMRNHSPFDLLANGSLFGRFGADLPKEMAALCEYCTCSAFVYYMNGINLLKMFALDSYKRRCFFGYFWGPFFLPFYI